MKKWLQTTKKKQKRHQQERQENVWRVKRQNRQKVKTTYTLANEGQAAYVI